MEIVKIKIRSAQNVGKSRLVGEKNKDLFFCIHQLHRPAQRPKTGLGVIGDEPCRLNGATQALWETVESTTCAEPSTGCPEEAIPQTDQAA